MPSLNYVKSGVNRKKADLFVDKIALLSQRVKSSKVLASVGGYASLYELNKNLILAATTDGVGTKLKLAFELNNHKTVGIDLVAMSINDLLCVGAKPLFFLDYFATSKLNLKTAQGVMEGIVEGCHLAGCSLVGGETAEMPGFYSRGEYDLAGFAVGMVSKKAILPKKDIRPGDLILGIASSGCHSNGYSLLRKLLPNKNQSKELLTPTRIYAKMLLPLIEKNLFKGFAHITGSGFLNVPRISEKVSYEIKLPPRDETPLIFNWVCEKSQLSLSELAQTFNLGVGMVGVLAQKNKAQVFEYFKNKNEKVWVLGRVVPKRPGKGSEVFVQDRRESAILSFA